MNKNLWPIVNGTPVRHVVDGHEFPDEESNLLGDGKFPPFRIFDVEAQDYVGDKFETRIEAEVECRRMNAEPQPKEGWDLQQLAATIRWMSGVFSEGMDVDIDDESSIDKEPFLVIDGKVMIGINRRDTKVYDVYQWAGPGPQRAGRWIKCGEQYHTLDCATHVMGIIATLRIGEGAQKIVSGEVDFVS